MKALIQKVLRGRVTVDGETVGEIGRGYVVFLGVKHEDTRDEAQYLANKTAALRVFRDDEDKMNRSLLDVDGSALVVSQFTLHADTRKGNRPSFVAAANPEQAEQLYEHYVNVMKTILGDNRVATGRFRAMMEVEIVNDGPVTIELKSRNEYS